MPYVKSRKPRGARNGKAPAGKPLTDPVMTSLTGWQSAAAITPVSWSFDGTAPFAGYLDSNGPTAGGPGQSASFVFSTDASGALTGWNINILGGIFSGTNSPSFAAITIGNAWSSTITQVPEIDSASAAGGLTLLFGSLAVLLSRRKNSRASRLTYGCAPTHRA